VPTDYRYIELRQREREEPHLKGSVSGVDDTVGNLPLHGVVGTGGKFATGTKDTSGTGGKLTAGVVDTDGKLPPV
jgi:hypothetical protein